MPQQLPPAPETALAPPWRLESTAHHQCLSPARVVVKESCSMAGSLKDWQAWHGSQAYGCHLPPLTPSTAPESQRRR